MSGPQGFDARHFGVRRDAREWQPVRTERSPRIAPPTKIILITGPTASGKSALALELAEAVGGEIVSADSMQVYRHLDIGTAKPSIPDRERIRHHLIDTTDPDEEYHAGRFRADADRAIRDVSERGRVAVVVGGTALYLKVLEQGLVLGPARDPLVRTELDDRWAAGESLALWEELQSVDPELASRLHPNDRTRIIRGLEVWLLTGRRLSSLQRAHSFSECRYRVLRIGLRVDRDLLNRRIDKRVLDMIDAGWVEEVRGVLEMGYSTEIPPLRALGYRQLRAHVLQGVDLARTVSDIQVETRRFAKRQMTWFRKMAIEWVEPGEVRGAVSRVKYFLQTRGAPL